ncbi:MAG: diguanylate cyclase [Kouleothrix sp.]|nr:diguanylate cyclase [Kouleothrix sp.]
MHVLIVDDDPVQRRILRSQLVRLGYDVREAADGDQAWTQLQQESAPIVITDWMMPQLDGPALIAQIRAAELPGYTYVILLTAKDHREDVVIGLEAGADDYLTKPCDAHELRARVAIGARIVDLERRLRAARDTDVLTGLRNRGAIAAAAEAELARSQRSTQPLSVALLDIDHFKLVNDRYGHQAGDQALRLVANVVRQHVRPYDVVGRWGGEELLLVLADTTLAAATTVAERVRAKIAATPLSWSEGSQIAVTASLGVVSTETSGAITLEQLVHDADAALYRAKADGRDCVRVAPDNR